MTEISYPLPPVEGGGSGVRAGLVCGEARLDDQDVDVCEERDAEEADLDRPEVAQEGHELVARQPPGSA